MSITTTTTTTTTNPAALWQAWRDLSDELAIRLAIDTASRRIATAYGR